MIQQLNILNNHETALLHLLDILQVIIRVLLPHFPQRGFTYPHLGLLSIQLKVVHVEFDEALWQQDLPHKIFIVHLLPLGLHPNFSHLLQCPLQLVLSEGVGDHFIEQRVSVPAGLVESLMSP